MAAVWQVEEQSRRTASRGAWAVITDSQASMVESHACAHRVAQRGVEATRRTLQVVQQLAPALILLVERAS